MAKGCYGKQQPKLLGVATVVSSREAFFGFHFRKLIDSTGWFSKIQCLLHNEYILLTKDTHRKIRKTEFIYISVVPKMIPAAAE